jgi:la-related protein 1
MDAEGWIPVSLLANFNRVRALTTDVTLVREVFALSSIVELQDDRVRLRDGLWRQFVLPDVPAVASASATGTSPQNAVAAKKDEEEVEIVTNH